MCVYMYLGTYRRVIYAYMYIAMCRGQMLEINFNHSSALFTEVRSLNQTHNLLMRLANNQLALRFTRQGWSYRWVALSPAFVWALEIQTLILMLARQALQPSSHLLSPTTLASEVGN